jgi:hypothetical protein
MIGLSYNQRFPRRLFLARTGCEQIKQNSARKDDTGDKNGKGSKSGKGWRHNRWRHNRCAGRVGCSNESSRSQPDILKSDKGKRGNDKIDGVKICSGSDRKKGHREGGHQGGH